MHHRRLEVFFYGLFMDPQVLEAKGIHPVDARLAAVPGFRLRKIEGSLRATLRMLRKLTRKRAMNVDDMRAVLAAGVARAGRGRALLRSCPLPRRFGE